MSTQRFVFALVYYIRICALAGTGFLPCGLLDLVYYIRICALAGTGYALGVLLNQVYYIRICALAGTQALAVD